MADSIIEKLKANTVIKGNLFPEQVHVIVAMPFGSAIKLIGRGDSNQVYDLVIPPDKFSEIEWRQIAGLRQYFSTLVFWHR